MIVPTIIGCIPQQYAYVPGWAMPPSVQMPDQDSPMTSNPKSDNAHSSMDMRKSMDGMQEKMKSMQMSGNTEYDFATMMRMHHQGALDMAQAELDNGKDPAMRNAAKKIIVSQKKEIAQFDRWIAQHKPAQSGTGAMTK